jgi:hypothetical protein
LQNKSHIYFCLDEIHLIYTAIKNLFSYSFFLKTKIKSMDEDSRGGAVGGWREHLAPVQEER